MKKIIAFVLTAILLASCNYEIKEKTYKPIVLDDHKILNDSTFKAIENYKYPAGFLYIIRVVDSADVTQIATVADKAYRNDKKKEPDGFGVYNRKVYVFVSKNPSLVQLRIEYDVRSGANKKGVTAGADYIAIQNIARKGNIDKSTLMMIEHAIKTIPEYWGTSNEKNAQYEKFHISGELKYWFSSKLERPRLNPDSFYSKYILCPILQLQLWLNNIWIGYLVFFLLVYLGIIVINAILFNLIFKNEDSMRTSIRKLKVSSLILIIAMVPAINSFAILTGARLETRLKLELMQLDGLNYFVFPDNYHAFNTAWWVAIIFIAVFYIRLLLKSYCTNSLDSCKEKINSPEFEVIKKASPLQAWVYKFRLKAITHDELLNDDDKDFYEFADEYKTFFWYAFILGLLLWMFIPKSVTWVLIFATIASIIIKLVELIFRKKEN